jgi:hypothetical protein
VLLGRSLAIVEGPQERPIMAQFLWLGSALGAVLGVLHGVHLYRQQAARVLTGGPGRRKAEGLYQGLWAFVLWTVFGAYVLAFWILGSVGLGVSRWLSARRAA